MWEWSDNIDWYRPYFYQFNGFFLTLLSIFITKFQSSPWHVTMGASLFESKLYRWLHVLHNRCIYIFFSRPAHLIPFYVNRYTNMHNHNSISKIWLVGIWFSFEEISKERQKRKGYWENVDLHVAIYFKTKILLVTQVTCGLLRINQHDSSKIGNGLRNFGGNLSYVNCLHYSFNLSKPPFLRTGLHCLYS